MYNITTKQRQRKGKIHDNTNKQYLLVKCKFLATRFIEINMYMKMNPLPIYQHILNLFFML